jgi:monovalent cation:H+ antiporter-2, CPA2 family
MHESNLILTLAGGLIAALALGYGAQRLGWSPIVGYLLAGILVGPHTPGFVADRHMAEQLAEVGVILLMFGVGLHFHLKDLLSVRRIAIAGALIQIAVIAALGGAVFQAFGYTLGQSALLGLALAISSTVVMIRVLSDSGQMHGPVGRVAVGWLVMEDIFTVFVLVVLPALTGGGAAHALAAALATAAVKIAVLAGFVLVAGGRLVPWLLHRVARTRSRELFTLAVLALALGIAAGSAHFFGVSMALGAFLAGMVVGQSEFSARAGAEALPMRDAFAVMFFLSVGLLFHPGETLAAPGPVLASLALVLIAKPAAAMLITVGLGYGTRIGWGVGLARGQVGEFSFLLASVARSAGLLPDTATNPLVAAAIASIMVNPIMYRLADPAERTLHHRFPRLWRVLNRRQVRDISAEPREPAAHRAVVVGYGPIGRLVSQILLDRGIQPVVIEMNVDTCRALLGAGRAAVHGDANQREVLDQAGVDHAESLVLSASGSGGVTEAIRIARELNPEILVVARTDFAAEREALRRAGADRVFSGEGEVAVAIAGSMLEHLGATPEQLDQTREAVRARLAGDPIRADN